MLGEYADLVFWIDSHTWTNSDNKTEVCRLYNVDGADLQASRSKLGLNGDPAHAVAQAIIGMSTTFEQINVISVGGLVQLTDVEQECDGLLSYDRTVKFSAADLKAMYDSTIKLIGKPVQCTPLPSSSGSDAACANVLPQWLSLDLQ